MVFKFYFTNEEHSISGRFSFSAPTLTGGEFLSFSQDTCRYLREYLDHIFEDVFYIEDARIEFNSDDLCISERYLDDSIPRTDIFPGVGMSYTIRRFDSRYRFNLEQMISIKCRTQHIYNNLKKVKDGKKR